MLMHHALESAKSR